MKFRFFIYTVSFILLIFTLAACQSNDGNTTASEVEVSDENDNDIPPIPQIDKPEVRPYNEILNRMWYVITNKEYVNSFKPGEIGISEVASNYSSIDEALDNIGYCVKDISGDGTAELIVGSTLPDNKIYSVFTSVDGSPQLLFEGSTNSYYNYAGNNTLIYYGSGSFTETIFGDFVLSEDGTTLSGNDFYFTYVENLTDAEKTYYHNETSELNDNVSEKISEEDFNKALSDFDSKTVKIGFTPLSSWQ